MANVCVITGGGSGMGLAAAKFMPKDKIIVISGRTLSKLEGALTNLKNLDIMLMQRRVIRLQEKALKNLLTLLFRLAKLKTL